MPWDEDGGQSGDREGDRGGAGASRRKTSAGESAREAGEATGAERRERRGEPGWSLAVPGGDGTGEEGWRLSAVGVRPTTRGGLRRVCGCRGTGGRRRAGAGVDQSADSGGVGTRVVRRGSGRPQAGKVQGVGGRAAATPYGALHWSVRLFFLIALDGGYICVSNGYGDSAATCVGGLWEKGQSPLAYSPITW